MLVLPTYDDVENVALMLRFAKLVTDRLYKSMRNLHGQALYVFLCSVVPLLDLASVVDFRLDGPLDSFCAGAMPSKMTLYKNHLTVLAVDHTSRYIFVLLR